MLGKLREIVKRRIGSCDHQNVQVRIESGQASYDRLAVIVVAVSELFGDHKTSLLERAR